MSSSYMTFLDVWFLSKLSQYQVSLTQDQIHYKDPLLLIRESFTKDEL
jgi:hypothetical protein